MFDGAFSWQVSLLVNSLILSCKQGYYSFAQKYLKNLFLTLVFTFCSTIFEDAPWESIVQFEQSIRKIAQMELIQI